MTTENAAAVADAPAASPAPAQTTALSTTFAGVQRTTFDDRAAAKSDQTPQYKGKKGQVDRIALLDYNTLLAARVHGHFSEDKKDKSLGYVFCRSTYKREGDIEVPVKIEACCKLLPEARKRLGTFIIKYAADPATGKPTKPPAYTPMVWIFSPDKYADLMNIHAEFPLNETDLVVHCEDDDFQKLKFTPTRECVRAHPEFVKRFGEMLESWKTLMLPKLERAIGRDVTDAEIVKVVGSGGAGSVSAAPVIQQAEVPKDIAGLFE